MDLGLLQRELAELIGVAAATIHNWECSHARPNSMHIPKIFEFMGYDPFDGELDSGYSTICKMTFGDHIRKKRLDLGITQRNLAKQMGVSVDAIRDWEKDRTKPQTEHQNKIVDFFEYNPYHVRDVQCGGSM